MQSAEKEEKHMRDKCAFPGFGRGFFFLEKYYKNKKDFYIF